MAAEDDLPDRKTESSADGNRRERKREETRALSVAEGL
jgi:hypothetical protein